MIDIQFLTKTLRSLSAITGLNFSLYDDRGNLLIAPPSEDLLLSRARISKKGHELYNNFLSKYLQLTSKNAQSLLMQGFTGQYHVFMPIRYKEVTLVALCEGFYLSRKDFTRFYAEKAEQFGLAGRPAEDWAGDLNFMDSRSIERHIKSIKPLLEGILSSGYEKGELGKRWQWSRTIIGLAANIGPDVKIEDIHQIIIDTVIFLFRVDTAAIFSMKEGRFQPESTGGRGREIVRKIKLSKDIYPVSNAIQSGMPVSVIDSHRLRHSGFPEEVISMYLFPINPQTGFPGFLGIFNCLLDRESFDSISGLCKLLAYLLSVRHQGDENAKRSAGLDLISTTTSELFYHYKDRQALCDSIVDESARFAGAEKCSLMLPDDDGEALMVISVKGVNKWLMKDVRVRTGEGIAGKVFQQGVPILIDNEEKLRTFSVKPRPLFKTQSCLSLPLKIAGETIGILNLSDKSTGEPFTQRELSALSSFAAEASILLKLNHCHRTSEQMRELSITDPLTGLFNRRYFDVRLEEEYRRAKRYNLHFSLAMMDIDDFKVLNDTEGHPAGDHALREIAMTITGCIRANDILVRVGGEEFALIMPQTSKDEAFNVLERIRNHVSVMPLGAGSGPVRNITISTGIAMFPECGKSPEDLILQADRALYSAKAFGKNQTVVWKGPGGFEPSVGDIRIRELPNAEVSRRPIKSPFGENHRQAGKTFGDFTI